MSMHARIIIPIILFLFVGLTTTDADQNTVVQMSTAALIQEDDFDSARLTAITQVKKRCVEKVLKSNLLESEEYEKNFDKLKKLFLNNPEPYISQLSIENEEIVDDGERYRVSVTANILNGAMKVALVENGIGNTLSMEPSSTIMVLIGERFETRISGTHTAETILIKILNENGFNVIDPEQKKLIDMRNRLFTESTLGVKAAQRAAMNFKADYLIFGEAAVTSSEPLSGTNLKVRYANLHLKIVESSSGYVIATENGQGKVKHADELTGGNWALEEAANKVGSKVISKFVSHLEQELISGTKITVDLCGLDHARQVLEAEEILRQTENVASLRQRFYFSNLCQFEVKFKGNSSELAKAFQNNEIGGQPLKSIETLPRYLRIKRGEEAQDAADDAGEIFKQYLEEKFRQFDMEKAREQDKELQQKINALAQSTKITDEQSKQLYVAKEEIKAAKKQAIYRRKEFEKREQELIAARTHAKRIKDRYSLVAQVLEQNIEQFDEKKLKTEVPKEESEIDTEDRYIHILNELEELKKRQSGKTEGKNEKLEKLYEQAKKQIESLNREKESAKKQNYTASKNHSNAESNRMSSAFKYLDSINEGLELVDKIGKFISSF